MNEIQLKMICSALNDYWEGVIPSTFGIQQLTVESMLQMDVGDLNKLLNLVWKSTDMPAPEGFLIPKKDKRSFCQICADKIGELVRRKELKYFFPSEETINLVNTWN